MFVSNGSLGSGLRAVPKIISSSSVSAPWRRFVNSPSLSVTEFEKIKNNKSTNGDCACTVGRVNSIESFSAVDGPGTRFVVFIQGCPHRCVFCSNPETWSFKGGEEQTVDSLIAKAKRVRVYLEKNGGGVTVSGGEPLIQPIFVSEFLKRVHSELHLPTAIDTTGNVSRSSWEKVLKHTDLVMLCPKSFDPKMYKEITGSNQQGMLDFVQGVRKLGLPIWLRYVLVPSMTDRDSDIEAIGKFARDNDNLVKVELLPYHDLGRHKWMELGLKYKLDHLNLYTKDQSVELFNKVRQEVPSAIDVSI